MAGPEQTYVSLLQPWANAANTPFRRYKHYVHEGGIATPLIVHWPAGIAPGNRNRINTTVIGHEIDIMPTLAEVAQATYPEAYKGHQITAEQGLSLVPTFQGAALPTRALFWEHEMNRAVRMGKWKLVAYADFSFPRKAYRLHSWELYNMDKDRGESRDLSKEMPALVQKMSAMWENYARKTDVYPLPWKEVSTWKK